MTAMSMNKAIHGAVRRDLARFVDALARFRDGDRERARQLARAWANFDFQLTHHHEGEHEIAWPALASVGVSEELLATMDQEHEVMAAALADVRTAMADFESSATGADDVRAAFERLREVTVTHLNHEEETIEPVFLANRDDPAIKEMGRKFARVSPRQGGQFMAWLTDGASPAEMAGVKDNVPGPVLTVMTGVFGRSYRRTIAPTWRV